MNIEAKLKFRCVRCTQCCATNCSANRICGKDHCKKHIGIMAKKCIKYKNIQYGVNDYIVNPSKLVELTIEELLKVMSILLKVSKMRREHLELAFKEDLRDNTHKLFIQRLINISNIALSLLEEAFTKKSINHKVSSNDSKDSEEYIKEETLSKNRTEIVKETTLTNREEIIKKIKTERALQEATLTNSTHKYISAAIESRQQYYSVIIWKLNYVVEKLNEKLKIWNMKLTMKDLPVKLLLVSPKILFCPQPKVIFVDLDHPINITKCIELFYAGNKIPFLWYYDDMETYFDLIICLMRIALDPSRRYFKYECIVYPDGRTQIAVMDGLQQKYKYTQKALVILSEFSLCSISPVDGVYEIIYKS